MAQTAERVTGAEEQMSNPPAVQGQLETQESAQENRRRRRRRPSQASSTTSEQPATNTRRLPAIRGTQPPPPEMVIGPGQDPVDVAAIRPPPVLKDAQPTSVPIASIFVQQPKRFRKTDREAYEQVLAERGVATNDDDGVGGAQVVGSMDAGAVLQRGFHSVALMLQGLLAGVSLCQCFFILLFSGEEQITFLLSFAPAALPSQTIYVAYVICAVGALDRYDIGQSFRRVVLRAVTFQSGAVSVLLYLGAVALLLLSAPFDERLDRSRTDRTQLFTTTTDDRRVAQPWLVDEVRVWKWAAVARAVLTVVAWLIVAGKPDTDQLHKHMRQTDQNFAESLNRAAAVAPAVDRPSQAQQQLT
uniref:Transmembrane protein n=1 Tax=Plectus sambesii TaxID=2011161 RepID=A0A914VRP8_9BILA